MVSFDVKKKINNTSVCLLHEYIYWMLKITEHELNWFWNRLHEMPWCQYKMSYMKFSSNLSV